MNVQGEMGSGRRVHPWVLEKFSSGNPGSRGLPSDSAIRPDGGLGGSGTTGNVRYPLFFTGVRHDVPIGQHFIQMADIRSDSSIMAKSRSNIFGPRNRFVRHRVPMIQHLKMIVQHGKKYVQHGRPICPSSQKNCPSSRNLCSIIDRRFRHRMGKILKDGSSF